MYQYIIDNKWEMFPTQKEIVAEIKLMEDLSFAKE
jgi:hypothetical protein